MAGWSRAAAAAAPLMLLLNCPNNAQTILKAYKISHHNSIPQAKIKTTVHSLSRSLARSCSRLSPYIQYTHISFNRITQCFVSNFEYFMANPKMRSIFFSLRIYWCKMINKIHLIVVFFRPPLYLSVPVPVCASQLLANYEYFLRWIYFAVKTEISTQIRTA